MKSTAGDNYHLHNRLADALSPYLRQHADNPVHWQPWDAAALMRAKCEDKPILLSIGYAACHWCHVMAHESFSDLQTAAVMNKYFINIKVDREERPDLDRIYQAAHYVFVRRAGGWPLTMFLTPAGEPFFGGTYFPLQDGRGLPSFISVMQRVEQVWRQQRGEIVAQNARVLPMLRAMDSHAHSADTLTDAPINAALRAFEDMLDFDLGGFNGAPKFPHPVEMAFCLNAGIGNAQLSAGIKNTLQKMAAGGINDQLGGGFYRYCVDERWAIPHFEKMLYDNGLLLALFADAACAFDCADLLSAAEGIATWTLRDMHHVDGGFYSSLDADSAGGEGAFYVWQDGEIKSHVSSSEYAVLESHFGLAAGANFEEKYHLARRQTIAQTAAALNIDEIACARQFKTATAKLLQVRDLRVRPATDDKVLAAWNGLMIRGLARAGRLHNRADWIAAAHTALSFIRRELMMDGKLSAVWRDGRRGDGAFLDDYAFLLDAALELLQTEFCADILAFATDLATQMCVHFEDTEHGGFFFTTGDEQLIRRPKPADDNAIPAGNGIAARALMILSRLSGDSRWQKTATRTLHSFYDAMQQQPAGCASLLSALRFYLSPPPLVLLSGENALCKAWQNRLIRENRDNVLVLILPSNTADLPPLLQQSPPSAGACAYVCTGMSCLPAVDSVAELRQLLIQSR